MASFPWEYMARMGPASEPRGRSDCVILIGLGAELPTGLNPDPEAYIVRIDPAVPQSIADSGASLQTEWGDALRLPTDGPLTQDHPALRAARRMRCTWVGNAKLFPTVHDLIIAASQHTDASSYYLARRPAPDAPYALVPRETQYHPMSGRLPPPSERSPRLCSILLSALWLAHAVQKCGMDKGARRIYPNLYSAYSTHTSAAILLISYHGLYFTGDGTVQDKFCAFAEYRAEFATRAIDLATALMLETRTKDLHSCALAIAALFA